MKINIFSYTFWPENFVINDLAEELAQRGHTITVQTGLPNYFTGSIDYRYSIFNGPYREEKNGYTILRHLVIPRKKGFLFLALNYASNIIFGFFNIFRMPKADISFCFAVSPLTHFIPVILNKFIFKTPIVLWYQDLWPDTFFSVTKTHEKSVLGRLLKIVVKWIYSQLDVILVQSPSFKNQLYEYKYQGQIEVVYNWALDFKAQQQNKVDLGFQKKPEDFIITFAGNLGLVQGLAEVLSAFKELKTLDFNIKLLLIGDGRFYDEVQKFVTQHKLDNIIILGRKPSEMMSAFYDKSDALLVSLNDDPTFNRVIPSKLQGYLSTQKPIIGFLNGEGARLIHESQSGLVAEAQNTKDLIKKIIILKNASNDQKEKWSENGYQFYLKNFQKDKIVQQIEKIFLDVIQKSEIK